MSKQSMTELANLIFHKPIEFQNDDIPDRYE